jgi:hypothetical protein
MSAEQMDKEKLRELEQEMRSDDGTSVEYYADRLRDILAAQPPKADESDAAVEAGCLAAVEVSGFNPKNWPNTYPDANQLRKVVRAVLNTATPTAAADSELVTRARLSVSYSHNFATAKPDIGTTEREHILGLCKLVEDLIPPTLMAARETEDDGAAIIGRLARALAKADPSSSLPRMAIEWLRSQGIHWKSHCPTDPLHNLGEPDDLPAFLTWMADELVRRDTRPGNFAQGVAESLKGRALVLRDAARNQEAGK